MNPVLIETLWNVKIYSKRLAGYLLRINRNIVECKADKQNILCRISTVLIETLWNVKYNACERGSNENAVLIETLWNVKQSTV